MMIKSGGLGQRAVPNPEPYTPQGRFPPQGWSPDDWVGVVDNQTEASYL